MARCSLVRVDNPRIIIRLFGISSLLVGSGMGLCKASPRRFNRSCPWHSLLVVWRIRKHLATLVLRFLQLHNLRRTTRRTLLQYSLGSCSSGFAISCSRGFCVWNKMAQATKTSHNATNNNANASAAILTPNHARAASPGHTVATLVKGKESYALLASRLRTTAGRMGLSSLLVTTGRALSLS